MIRTQLWAYAPLGLGCRVLLLRTAAVLLTDWCDVQALEEKNKEVAGDDDSDEDFEEGMGDIDVDAKPAMALED